MIAVDSSVVIAAFASWHEAHATAIRVIVDRPRLPAACALESYAVLTRLPAPHRAHAGIVRDFLRRTFPDELLTLPSDRLVGLVAELVDLGIVGGASHDAVIALTSKHHGHELVTLDDRARATYDRVGGSVRYLGRADPPM